MRYKKGVILKYIYWDEDNLFVINDVDFAREKYELVDVNTGLTHGYFDESFVTKEMFFTLHKEPQDMGW